MALRDVFRRLFGRDDDGNGYVPAGTGRAYCFRYSGRLEYGGRIAGRCPEWGGAVSAFVRLGAPPSRPIRLDGRAAALLDVVAVRFERSRTDLLSAAVLGMEREKGWADALDLLEKNPPEYLVAKTVRVWAAAYDALRRAGRRQGYPVSALAGAAVFYANATGWGEAIDLIYRRRLS